MCLLVIGHGVHASYPLIIAGNRDEFHARPTKDAHWWPDVPGVLGGRDLQAGGSWLALHRSGRFASVTNFRDAQHEAGGKLSRGHLVTGFLESGLGPKQYLGLVDGDRYAGFNLLVGDGSTLAYMSNRGVEPRTLEPGVYGLSNAVLDTAWSKVERSKAILRSLVQSDSINPTTLFRMLDDRAKGPISEVETGRLPFRMSHALTAPFIVLPDYGTRCSSIVLADTSGNWEFVERRFTPTGAQSGESQFSFARQE